MNKRLEQNRVKLQRSSYFDLKEAYAKEIKNQNLTYKKATQDQLLRIRSKIKEKQLANTKRNIVIFSLALLVSFLFMSLLIYWFSFW